jgi:hypothetical protein
MLLAGVGRCYVFDTIDVSSKSRGMGGAWTAGVDDATATYYNPAGLMATDRPNGYATFFQPNNQSFEMLGFFAFGFPVGENQRAGVGFRGFGVEYEGVDLMDEWTLSLSYALALREDIHTRFYVGGTVNVYSLSFASTETVDLGRQSALGVDLGLLAVLRERTRFGFFMKNLNEPTMGKSIEEPLPQWISAGVSYVPYYGVVTELDLRSVRGEDPEIHMGMEFAVTEFLATRFGFETEPNSLTGGFSLKVRDFGLDYAYSSHSVLPGTHHVALRAAF